MSIQLPHLRHTWHNLSMNVNSARVEKYWVIFPWKKLFLSQSEILRVYPKNLCLYKPSMWFCHMLKFEKYCSSLRDGLSWWLRGKEFTCNAGDVGSIPWLGGSPGEGNGNPLQYSCLWNPMARGAWWATVHSVTKE